VARILLAELAVAVFLAVPIGLFLAQWLLGLILGARDNESFDVPAVISSGTFAAAALVVLGAAFASAVLVRRRIDRLDLVAALKARD
jgi:putative ABC transport system permease protein